MTLIARGEFEDALARIDLAEAFAARHHLTEGFGGAHRFARGWIALERGDFESAGVLLSERVGEDNVHPARGALLMDRPERAIEMLAAYDLSASPGAPVRQLEVEMDPHLVASHAFERLGDRERAEAEALRELDVRRRYGPPQRLALALRRRASFLPARAALPLLEEAVALAEATPRRPLLARVLASYGAALRRCGRVDEARGVLYRAIDDAEQMGMERVRTRAQAELLRAGGRPRRARLGGPTSLTEAQRQVAELAAAGRTNREIAEQLFVTIKTIETHLAAAYRKLEVSHREQLAEALSESPDDGSTGKVLLSQP
jgi:DNA-binding CsgD family transcriptional regulator